ncbi:Chemotaxis protein CheA [Roseimaritima multifibrata]|uniref:Chemotaxis protein CheA n=1 Tax=Roseimaritima multifibrata TaxID=1930274 RepID=A0A517MI90_9BACT|nr:chemotaxis protein CheA [Roseimaritima multifibrata]QDS94595.1 Chemotaxis protein CheA [Roseimaritima multifibrata]
MSDNTQNSSGPNDDMSEYLQTFLDETEEQLDDLVETMLSLERDSTNSEDLNESFRLIHSIKGSAGMMGLEQITVLTHHLENRFERFRSGTEQLDEPTMNVVLRCVDFLRQSNDRLRDGNALGSPTELLSELKRLEDQAALQKNTSKETASESTAEEAITEATLEPTPEDTPPKAEHPTEIPPASPELHDSPIRMVIRFRPRLQLVDLKAQLIVNRLAGLGTIKSTRPTLESLSEDEPLEEFELQIETDRDLDNLRSAAQVDGVDSIDFPEDVDKSSKTAERRASVEYPDVNLPAESTDSDAPEFGTKQNSITVIEPIQSAEPTESAEPTIDAEPTESADTVAANKIDIDPQPMDVPEPAESAQSPQPVETVNAADAPTVSDVPTSDKAAGKVAETMRVEIDRLDSLMNLAGELVVNRARFVQISSQINPSHRKASALNRIREFCDSLRDTIEGLENETAEPSDRGALVTQLRCGLELMDEHSEIWEHDRGHLDKFGEAIDQLSRVSKNLQKGVLDTRMVPVGPLFNRFKRVVRDLSKERDKRVNLLIRGEKTELDKRMIDALGDPLMHLVRNSIDHGLEPTQVRLDSHKPEIGTISLEATHSGNNIYIHVRDDGGGIDVDKIKTKLINNQVLSKAATSELSDAQALDYIWHPGFSTAQEVTDVSGRGVGMDVVQNRIRKLNGTIEVESIPKQGTHFTIRLPLTLAIINCLLVKIRGVVFSMPIDEVREIVSVKEEEIVTVQGKRTIDVRDEFIPLVRIDEVFHWNNWGQKDDEPVRGDSNVDANASQVVIVQTAGKTMGLHVDELIGSHDMVIKSLSDNFIEIRGLSGASILGDGNVGLMLDIGTAYQMATQPSTRTATEELSS